jgi:hypothetical protein
MAQTPAGGSAPAPGVDAGVPPAPSASSGAGAPPSSGISLWFSNGLVQDFIAAGVGGPHDYDFHIADLLSGFVGYGMDVVTVNQAGRLSASFDYDWTNPPSMLVVTGRLAQLVWDGMTKAVVTTSGDVTIRESPGGRVHCELSTRSPALQCGFRGVVRADFR